MDNANLIFHSKRKVLALLAICHFRTHNIIEALLHLEQAEKLPFDSNYGECFVNYARALKHVGEQADSLKFMDDAYECLRNIPTVDHRWYVYLAIEKAVLLKAHKLGSEKIISIEHAHELAVKFGHLQTTTWLTKHETLIDTPIAELPKTQLNVVQIIESAERDANKKRALMLEAELSFRHKMDAICAMQVTEQLLAKQFCQLLYNNFNLTEIAIQETFIGDAQSILACFPENTTTLSLSNTRVFPSPQETGLRVLDDIPNIAFSLTMMGSKNSIGSQFSLLALSSRREPMPSEADVKLINWAFNKLDQQLQFSQLKHMLSPTVIANKNSA